MRKIRGNTQIMPETIYNDQIAEGAGISPFKIANLASLEGETDFALSMLAVRLNVLHGLEDLEAEFDFETTKHNIP